MKKWAYGMIALAAFLWGIIGIFVQALFSLGLSSLQIVSVRVVSAAIILLIYVYIKDKSLLIIKFKDWYYFIGTGIFSFAFFNWFFFTAIKEINLSMAVILLYTAPVFVAILSRIFLKESFTLRKIVSLLLTFFGITFVIGFFPHIGQIDISLFGLLVGIGSGLTYALYSIFGKAALRKYHSLTITTYTFVFASAAILPFSGLWQIREVFLQFDTWMYTIGLGLFPTSLAVMLYTTGLFYVESSRAAIIATVEPVVGTILGVVMFGDVLTYWQIFGIVVVLFAVIMIQETRKNGSQISDA